MAVTNKLPKETWYDKRIKSVDEGGFGTAFEQLEILGEQGIQAFQDHADAVKARFPKDKGKKEPN